MKKQLVLLSALFLTATATFAQFEASGVIRPRTEYRNGFGAPIADDAEPGVGTSTRVRANFGYKHKRFDFFVSFQDVFVWGENRQIKPEDDNNSFNVFQAYTDIKLDTVGKFSLKLGRQVLSYDDQRILGGLDWAQQGRNHDLALLKFKSNGYKLDLGFAFNQDYSHPTGYTSVGNEYSTSAFFTYKTMQMLHANKKWDKLGVSILAMNNGFQDASLGLTDVANLQTIGTHIKFKSGAFDLAANGYIQTGEAIYTNPPGTAGSYQDVSGAFLAGIDFGYKVGKVKLLAGAEIISGNSETEAGKTSAFFPLYGTNHKFNGFMDYFYVGNHANTVGLIDVHVGAKANLGKGWGVLGKVLNFQSEQELASGETQLGTEVDLVVSKKFDGFVLKAGYSQMFESDGMYELKNNGVTADNAAGAQNWAWAMLVFKPKFL